MEMKYVHYGCGLTAPKEWENYDVSPTLKIQKIPAVGKLLKRRLNVVFPENVKIGDIRNGLPVDSNSCDGVYCSHVLEHLSLEDFRKAIRNTYKILKPDGIFRCVVPDLESAARQYLNSLDKSNGEASIEFIKNTRLGIESRPGGFRGFLVSLFGNTHHLWMWDHYSLINELEKAGFKQIRKCRINDCEDKMFNLVEEVGRFKDAVAIECKK